MAGSEMTPLARTGGLGDVLAALPAELQKLGHEVGIALPYYRSIRENASLKPKRAGKPFSIQVGDRKMEAEILQCGTADGVRLYFVRQDELFDRPGIYGTGDQDYDDNAARFIFFSKSVVELARRMATPPDILHVHDWQTALVPVFVHALDLPFKTLLTIHNLAYQGSFWGIDFRLTNLPWNYASTTGLEFYGNVNFLKGGILFSDAITTVSERYARDIQTPEFGCALDAVIRERSGKLFGILNGADYSVWNPASDRLIPKTYKPATLTGKKNCRSALLDEFDLKKNPGGPVFSMVSRLAEQKGIDVLLPLIDRLLADDVRLVILGEGESTYERELMIAQKKHRSKFAFHRGFDNRLAHLITAGADACLIPSHSEPCSLSAMYSLKYGTVPIARACGGLYQVIQDYDPTTGAGNGFLFFDYSDQAFWDAIKRAKRLFENAGEWKSLVQVAMAGNFSWKKSAQEYGKIYKKITA